MLYYSMRPPFFFVDHPYLESTTVLSDIYKKHDMHDRIFNHIFENCMVLRNNTWECGTLKHVMKNIIGWHLNFAFIWQ